MVRLTFVDPLRGMMFMRIFLCYNTLSAPQNSYFPNALKINKYNYPGGIF